MARPRPDLPPREAVAALIDDKGQLSVRVSPGARHAAVQLGDGALQVRVTAAPEDGKANKAVIALVANALGIAPSRIELVRGQTARDKVLRIEV